MTTSYNPSTIQSTLDNDARERVATELQATVVDLIDLSLTTKQLHWNVVGPNFRSIHLLLDEIVGGLRKYSDEVAERMTATGSPSTGTASFVSSNTKLGSIPSGWVQDTDVATMLAAMILDTASAVRTRAGRIEELDVASHDLLVELLQHLEENAWMLQAVTAKAAAANTASHTGATSKATKKGNHASA